MLRLAVVLCAVVALASAEVESNSGPYNAVQTAYGPPPAPPAPPASQPAPARTGYESHQYQYQPAGYGVDPAAYGEDASAGFFPSPLGAVVGYKLTAVGFVLKALAWLVWHAWAVVLGAVATFAFCKVTAVCDLAYRKLAAEHLHEQVRSLMTPERIASASKLLDDAMEKYAGKKN